MAKQTTKADMTAELAKAIKPKVEGYLGETPPPKKREQAVKAALELVSEEFSKYKTLGKLADEAIDKVIPSQAAHQKHRRREIAEALVDAAASLDLPVQIKPSVKPTKTKAKKIKAKPAGKPTPKPTAKAKPKAKPAAKSKRVTQAEMAERCDMVLKVLPAKGGKYTAKSDIAGMAGLTPDATHNVLTNLKRQGKAENNGERASKAGWRKV